MESLKKKHTLTFYRRMANTNPSIMKKYKSAVINSMTFKQLVKIYSENNLKFEEDVGRLLMFKNSEPEPNTELNLYNSILLSDNITKKYPYIKHDTVIYSILNSTRSSNKQKYNFDTTKIDNNKYYSKFVSFIESLKMYFLNLR